MVMNVESHLRECTTIGKQVFKNISYNFECTEALPLSAECIRHLRKMNEGHHSYPGTLKKCWSGKNVCIHKIENHSKVTTTDRSIVSLLCDSITEKKEWFESMFSTCIQKISILFLLIFNLTKEKGKVTAECCCSKRKKTNAKEN